MIPEWYAKFEAWVSRHRIVATAPVAVLLLALARPTAWSLCIGGSVVLLGEAGRMWASGYIDKNMELATAGPYRYTRNPLYVANLILLIGFCVIAANPYVALLALLAFAMIYRPVLMNEARHMRELFGEDYRRWAEYVPMFFPRFPGYKGKPRAFSWPLVIQHREHKNAIAFIAGIAVFAGLYLWRG